MEKRELHSVLTDFLNENLIQATASGQAEKNDFLKARIRPVLAKGVLHFQAEEFIGKQAFHKNLTAEEAAAYLEGLMETSFRQLQLEARDKSGSVLVSKKGKVTVKVKKKPVSGNTSGNGASASGTNGSDASDAALQAAWANGLSHNRKKRYILEEGIPVPFLVELGVQTKDGAIVHAKYDKFRQINRFLEFIEDVLPKLDKNKETRIIDFGCGKSYLTFAMYYYLKVLKGYPVRITGLDLKTDVIEHCSQLAKKFGYDSLEFLHGDIASYEGTDQVDMVVTLHACDTATDYALEKAVRWNAKVILSVPCCQHEVNKQMKSDLFAPGIPLRDHQRAHGRPLHRRPARGDPRGHGVPGPDPGIHRHGTHAKEPPDPGCKAGKEEGEPEGDRSDPGGDPCGADALPAFIRKEPKRITAAGSSKKPQIPFHGAAAHFLSADFKSLHGRMFQCNIRILTEKGVQLTMERLYQYDVVVVGGGTAGVSAAVGAAKTGAKTLLIERNAYLGGEATHSGVSTFCGFFTCGKNPVRVVEGVGQLVLDEMGALGPTVDYVISATGNYNVNFQPEYLKCAMDNLLEKEHVDYFLHTYMTSAKVELGSIVSIQCSDDEGSFTVMAKTFVDASGDANLVHRSGAKLIWGGDDGHPQAATMPFRLSGVNTNCDMSPEAVGRAVRKAKEAGIPNLTREKGFILKKEHSDIVSVLLPSVIPEGLTAADLTHMERETRKQVLSYVQALKTYMPGMEHAELAVIGPSIGFRETRRMVGKETLTVDDVLTGKKCQNSVARCGWKPEIHKDVDKMATYLDVKEGSYFDIPLGALQSENIENLYGAGRMISSDEAAFAAVRVMGTCFATGHAAGVAAACHALEGTAEIKHVQEVLKKQGALV